jgi:DNA-binding MarR family transcriptional regulator
MEPIYVQWSFIIDLIKYNPDITYHAIARTLMTDKSAMRRKLLRMEERGYLKRDYEGRRCFWRVLNEVTYG